jgi:aldose 1-epimerase
MNALRILQLLFAAACLGVASAGAVPASATKSLYGRMPDGTPVYLYTLTNGRNLICKVITYGGIITEIDAPDRTGKLEDIVLGCSSLEGYLKKPPYFGAIIGRVANRIAQGRFTLDGKTYSLATNDGPNHLHGGNRGFDKVVWEARALPGAAVELSHTSTDGEEGYPGTLRAKVTYRLTEDNRLRIDYEATADQATPVNLTNHTYWNLAGRGTILNQVLRLNASRYTPVDATLIPTGEMAPVANGPMDFRSPKPIGRDLGQLTNTPQGYDHNWVLDSVGVQKTPAAQLYDPSTGRVLEIFTDQPGIQFYSGNFLDGTITGKRGAIYRQYDGLCLETQHFPDSVHHPDFPSTILRPGATYRTTTICFFSTR